MWRTRHLWHDVFKGQGCGWCRHSIKLHFSIPNGVKLLLLHAVTDTSAILTLGNSTNFALVRRCSSQTFVSHHAMPSLQELKHRQLTFILCSIGELTCEFEPITVKQIVPKSPEFLCEAEMHRAATAATA